MSVKVREKPLKDGRKSIYLDFYPAIKNPKTGKETRREFLSIYIYSKPKDIIEKEYNKEKRDTADAIRGLREIAIKNHEFGFIDKETAKGDFLKYFREVADTRDDKNWGIALKHFEKYTSGYCIVSDMNEKYCNGFKNYLKIAKNLNTGGTISVNTALAYFGKFRALLKQAFHDKILNENLNDRIEGIKPEETRREFLTLDELRKLFETPCPIQVLKDAAMFSALSGLRYSDIQKLTWSDVQLYDDGGSCIRFRQKKTKGEQTLPISTEAFELMGERRNPNDQVFNGFIYSMTQIHLKRWLLLAGIYRNITFHSFRHTYATLQITLGTDIYTVSKMLGHKKIETTQIYAKIIDEKKREATNKIKLKF